MPPSTLRTLTAAFLLATVAACHDTPIIEAGIPSMLLTPMSLTLSPGDSAPVHIRLWDAARNEVTRPSIIWSVADTSVAALRSVDAATIRVVARRPGTTIVLMNWLDEQTSLSVPLVVRSP